jgi:hypothetical protein
MIDDDPSLWIRLLGTRRELILASVEEITTAIESAARDGARLARDEAARCKARRPRHDNHGRRGVAETGRIQSKLIELVDRLRTSNSGYWTLRAVAELIRESQSAWLHPPCPDITSRYRRVGDRDDPRGIGGLIAWIANNISRGKTRSSNRAKRTRRSARKR